MAATRRISVNLLLIAIAVCPFLMGQEQHGSVCVVPNSPELPTRISPGGDYNPATLKIRIDKREAIPWPHKLPVRIDDLELSGRHLVVLISDGKAIQSFWFRFSDYKSGELAFRFMAIRAWACEIGKTRLFASVSRLAAAVVVGFPSLPI